MAADDVLRRYRHPTRAEIEEGLAGNLCRCGCYYQIIEAVESVVAGDEHCDRRPGAAREPTPIPTPPVDQ